ncbi:MBG domain-containing protein, partial [Mesorhizobium sp. M7A.F.Ca.CA.004.08.1.1]
TLVTNNGGTGGTISYALGASATFTGTPGAQALSIDGQSYTLIYDVNGLQAINSGLTERYALANNIEASSTYYWNNLLGFTALGTDGNTNIQNGGNGFTGTFDGLGHIINQIWVRQIPANYVGLFGYVGSTGVVRNVGLVDAYISGSYNTGAIAGFSKGTISGVWASGYLEGVAAVGGLVGRNEGTITGSFSTNAVRGHDGSQIGGIAGFNSSTISQVHASGSVVGGDNIGGLVGFNVGAISDGYSTGAVLGLLGATGVGGSVGFSWGTVTNVYFDTTTSGTTTGVAGQGAAGVTSTGLTTAQLQGGGATSLSSAFVGGTGGLYPYLNSFYPNGIQAISGIAYKDGGITPLSSATRQPYYAKNPGWVTGVSNGVDIGTVTTGVNGYYYIAVPTGWISDSVLAYTVRDSHPDDSSGAQNGVTFRTGLAGGNVSNLNVYGNWRLDEADSSITSLSALQDAAAATVGSTYVGSLSFANWQIETAATTFAIDRAVSIGAGTLALSSNGTVTQTHGLAAASLLLGGAGDFNLNNGGNQIGTIAANAGSVSLFDLGGFVVGGVINARGVVTAGATTTGQVKLQTTGDLTMAVGAKVSGIDPVLSAMGRFVNNRGSDAVTATSGRWLIYAANPTGNTFGNLDSGNTAVWNTTAGATVSATGNRYVFNYQPTLTLKSENAAKTYGDTAMPALTYTVSGYQAGVTNAYLGDAAANTFGGAPSLSTATLSGNEQVGSGPYAISISTGNVAASNGYALAFNSAGLLSIAKRAVTVIATSGQGKTYGDVDPSSYAYSVSSLGTGVALVGTLGRDVGENADMYAIGQGTLTNGNNSNYDITYVGADFTIGKRAVTVTASAAQGKTYGDGDPSSYGYTVSNLGSGASLLGALDRVTGENAGTYAIGQGNLGVSNANYAITYVGANFTIDKRAVTVTANAGLGKTYGNADPLSYGYAVTDLGTGVALVGALGRSAGEGVGTYAIGRGSLTDAANANYDISYVGAGFSIGKRAVTVTADSGLSKTYGDSDPLSYGYTVSDLGTGTALVGALDRAAGENAGSHAIGRGTLTDAANGNYDINYVGANFSIGKRAITVTANAGQGKIYGDSNPSSFGYSVSDLGSGALLVGALDRAAGETVGNYAIGQGTLTNAENSNYAISYVGAGFSIGKRAVTVTANAGQGKSYGDADPSSLGYTVSDLGSGAALTGALDRAAGETVGGYAMGQGGITNAANSNYDISYVGADFSIGKRAITVVADAQSRPQGTANPPLTYTVGGLGLVNGDMFAGGLSTEATTASMPGIYAIEQGSLTISANYELTYVGADLVVQPANAVPPTEAASVVVHNADMHGGGQPPPIFFAGQPSDGGTQTLVEDPRLNGPALCQGIGDIASVCTVASVQ